MRYVLKLTTAKVRLMTLAIVALAAAGSYFTSLWPVVLADIYNGLSAGAIFSLETAAAPAAQFAICLVLAELLGIVRRVATDVAAADLEASARTHSLESTLALPVSRVGGALSAELATLVNQGVEGCCQVFKLACNDLVPSVATVAFVAYQVVCGAPPVILACMLGYVATTAALSFFQIRSQNGIRDGINVKQSNLAGNVAQSLANHEGIRTMAAEAHEARRLSGRIQGIAKLEKYHHRVMGGFDSAKQTGKAAFFVAILLAGVWMVSAGQMSGGMVVAAMMLFNQLTVPLDSVYRLLDEFASSNVKIGRLVDIDAEAQAARDARAEQVRASRAQEMVSGAVAASAGAGAGAAAAPASLAAEAAFEAPAASAFPMAPAAPASAAAPVAPAVPAAAVAIAEASDVAVLAPNGHIINSGLSFSIPAGTMFCLDGGNGCGKSSLMKALLGYFPHTGSIRVLNRPLESYEPAELARTVFYLPQRPFLFSGTIAENVSYGLDLQPSDQALRAALDLALVRQGEFGEDPLTYQVSEGGGNLSGGQRQRIAAARLFLRQPTVLFLDEATASIDIESALRLMANIKAHMAKTGGNIVLITHQNEVKALCDGFLSLEQGSLSMVAGNARSAAASAAATAVAVEPELPMAADPAAAAPAAPAAASAVAPTPVRSHPSIAA